MQAVWRWADGDQRIALVPGGEPARALDRLRDRLLVGSGRAGPVVHGTSEDETDSDVTGRADDGLVVAGAVVVDVEEVGDRRHTVAQHLPEGEESPRVDCLLVQIRGVS